MLNNKIILITGGTGSFGVAVTKYILKNFKPRKIIIYSRDEFKQYSFQKSIEKKYQKNLRFFIGDIRDYNRLNFAFKDVDIVIHAAALKQVPTIEYNPFEAVKTNIIGSQNVISASLENKVQKLIALSSDKAAAPINLYGATKLTADKLFISANNYIGKKIFCSSVVRYGNVMGSRGSVIPYFIKNKHNNFLEITDVRMTRFSITLEQGVKFVIKSLSKMIGGEIFVPKIPSYKILDLAKAISPKLKIKIVGIRPGEKIHEEMITKTDSINTIDCNSYYVILPTSEFISDKIKKIIKINKGKKCSKDFSYNSENNTEFLNADQIRKMISKTNY
jgi:UDP-N-acetylglucosamine 4,6-dehydratase (inverting)